MGRCRRRLPRASGAHPGLPPTSEPACVVLRCRPPADLRARLRRAPGPAADRPPPCRSLPRPSRVARRPTWWRDLFFVAW